MDRPSFFRRRSTWLVGIPVLVLLVAVVAPWAYINFIKEEADAPLTFADLEQDADASDPARSSTSGPAAEPDAVVLDGTWRVAGSSTAGYRVEEVLAGQDTTATGRTSQITGELGITGSTVDSVSVEVDVASITSDQPLRDSAFRGRIMETDRFPKASFSTTDELALPSLPGENEQVSVTVAGELTLHGVTKPVTIDLTARRVGDRIEVVGNIPVLLSDFAIADPSGPVVTIKDRTEIEFALAFERA